MAHFGSDESCHFFFLMRVKPSLPRHFSGRLPVLRQLHGRSGSRGGVGSGVAGRLKRQRGCGGRHGHVQALHGLGEGPVGLVLGTEDVAVGLVDLYCGHRVQALQAERGRPPDGVTAADGPELHGRLVHVDVQDLVGVLGIRQILEGLFQLPTQGLKRRAILRAQEPAGEHQGVAGEEEE